ncbi:sulfite exporter TauE/SafE family protein [Streptomyces sp. Isolate_219]|uniref:urease accessory protein UreH domain-containing protein n=1 Tax=Streptomyces sp. Isolate_219 TaxID=2950110 RepID=UPI0021C89375|nr:sulfite exporter TauE/SafE family protein [Streptomyces sp. Isolate_219]MCR8574154.1 sulfite exporter TauE/SafE family protein [Streptomyces sp. Isolate_219]
MHTLSHACSKAARPLLVGVLTTLVLLGLTGTANAHPFGTPPAARIKAHGKTVEVIWSAAKDDLAVLRKETHAADESEARYLGSHIRLSQDGRPCPLQHADTARLVQEGARLRYRCPQQVTTLAVTITALNDVDPKYRTISVTQSGGGGLHTAAGPTHTLTLAPSGSGNSDAAARPQGPFSVWTTDLSGLLQHRVVLPLALLIAAAVGAFHACAPGHGKTLAAGFLLGGRGRARDAVWLGVIVAVMHTASVAALALAWWLAADNAPDIAAVTAWLQLIAALVVVCVGVGLLRRHLGSRDHGRHHHHDHGHSHSPPHRLPGTSLLTWRGIALLGTSGGLLPSPSAFLVLLSGLLTGQVGAAMLMVAAFGLGMALTLTGVGLVALRGRDALLTRAINSPKLHGWTLRAPVIAASTVVLGGSVASVLALTRVLAP